MTTFFLKIAYFGLIMLNGEVKNICCKLLILYGVTEVKRMVAGAGFEPATSGL